MFKKLLIVTVPLIFAFSTFAEMTSCKFNFGTDWDFIHNNQGTSAAQAVDYVTIWLNDPEFNIYWHGDMVKYCISNNKTPVFYAYIIAKASGLGDGDVGGRLTTEGAAWLKNNFNTVKSRYQNYASNIANQYGKDKPCIWLMEPDYYQYFSGPQSVKLSFSDAASYMNELITIIKNQLPNALISLDISPWNNDQASWLGAFDLSKFTFLHTSGGRTEAGNSRIRMDNGNDVTWAGISQLSGKPIIADDGYGTGGGSTGHDNTWDDVNNLKARIADGVIAITQKSPRADWGGTINNLKSSLASQTVKCFGSSGPTTFSLEITTGTGGTVSKNPNKTSYDKGAQVTLTAQPQNGYVFEKWSGDASGTNATITVTMDGDKKITASFKQIPSNEFTLTVNIVGSGTVTKNPDQSSYTGGTAVTLTANPTPGRSVFSGWSGGASGTNQTVTITLNSNQTVTATFTDTATVQEIKVEAEDFTSKSGDNIVVEDKGTHKNIGYIEAGNSTTYKVDISKSGKYAFSFRVATAQDNGSFSVSVDGSNKGTVSFTNTGDWQQYAMKELQGTVDMEAGQRTIQLTYNGAMNLDYFIITLMSTPVAHNPVKINPSEIKTFSTETGFRAVLPASHSFKSYSLVNLNGRIVRSGHISAQTRNIDFKNLNQEVMILRLEGKDGMRVVRPAVVR